MDAANNIDPRARYGYPLAGLQAGVFGALMMLAWLMLSAQSSGNSPWLPANLFAILFHGPKAYRDFYHPDAWSGVAFIVFAYGLAGAGWGVLLAHFGHSDRPLVLILYGVLTGLLVHTLIFGILMKTWAPLIVMYAPDMAMRFGHVLWGLTLAKTPRYARQIEEHLAHHPWH